MGAWSYHPMGSDLAYDVRDDFFERIFEVVNHKKLDKCGDSLNAVLETLTVTDMKNICKNDYFCGNSFVLPYVFNEMGCIPKDDKVKEFLRNCLYDHDYLGSTEEEYGTSIEKTSMKKLKREMPSLAYIKDFLNNFDDYIMQRKPMAQDPGLFAAMAKNSKK